LNSYALASSIGSYFNTATKSTTDSNNYITFSGSGNTVTLGYDNLLSALGSFALTSSLGSYALTNSPTFTGTVDFTGATVNGLSKTTVGLTNVDNTSDANKPISTAMSTALAGKQDTIGNTGTTRISASFVGSGTVNDTRYGYIANLTSDAQSQITTLSTDKANKASPIFSGNTTYGASSTVDFTNCTVSNFPLTTVFAGAFIGTSGTASNTRGAIISPNRNGVGVVTVTLGTAHPAGVFYTVNAATCVTSSTSNPIICSVIKLPTTSTQFRLLFKDHTNTAVDCDFVVSVI
jgi:hypothetical protein